MSCERLSSPTPTTSGVFTFVRGKRHIEAG
jgi:hypothetical protein